MPDTNYDVDHALRSDIAAILAEHDYKLDGFTLTDKLSSADNGRTVTVKASRSLDISQGRLDLKR